MKGPVWCLLGCLLTAPATAHFDWAEYREYQPQTSLLRFAAERQQAFGQLVIWPEQQQVHTWLGMANWWQRRGWDLLLLLPDAQQGRFNPATEQVDEQQQAWLTTLGERLAPVFEHQPDMPQLVLTQGSAALWYQQLTQTGVLPAPDGLIVLNATPVDQAQQGMLAMSLARSHWPVLDLFSEPQAVTLLNQELRRQTSARQESEYETQLIHSPLFSSRMIAAWMTRYGWMPLPPSAPDFLKGVIPDEASLSRSQDAGSRRDTAPAEP